VKLWPFSKPVKVEKKDAASSFFDYLWPSATTKTGIVVTPERAMRQVTAYACVRIISETVAQIPLHVFERGSDGTKERDTASALHRIFSRSANPWTTAYQFKSDMTADVLLHGSAFALVQRDAEGNTRYLTKWPARAVHVEEDRLTGEPRYRVTLNDGGSRIYAHTDVLHLRATGGLSPIQQAKEAIAIALSQEGELADLLTSGMRPAGVLTFENEMSDSALERAQAQFTALNKSKGTAILDGSAKYHALGMAGADAQFLEGRRHQVAEIARAFRVPLHMLQELERTTHLNAEQLGRQFLQLTMLPWLKMWEQSLNLVLFADDQSRYAEFMVDDLQRADLASRMEAYAKAVQAGLLNPNEVRSMENRAPYEGGDKFLRPLNMEEAGNG